MTSRTGVVLLVVGALLVGLVVGIRIGSGSGGEVQPAAVEPVPSLSPAVSPRVTPTPTATESRALSRSPRPTQTASAGLVRDLYVIDGDTVAAGRVDVRLLGIDTPEAGECGFDESTAFAERFLRRGGRISNGSGYDHYGRLLAYVSNARGRDLGASLIRSGLANARYDSTDGYDWHPNQDWYHRLDARTRHVCGIAADDLGGP